MVIDSPATQLEESPTIAGDCIRTGPVPSWVEPWAVPVDFKSAAAVAITHLLYDRQMHAELKQTFVHAAVRLESMPAVQDHSPWRLDFDPRTQRIALHGIQTWRNGAPRAQADLSAVRVVDRRAPGANPAKPLSLSLMLEDLRPGDILEWSYTVENRPLLLPQLCAALFALPPAAAVGRFHFSVLFDARRPMRWASSLPDWEPVKKEDNGAALWSWAGEDFPGVPSEDDTPAWHISYPWIQVSDCPDWGTIAAAFTEAWPEDAEDAAALEIAAEVAGGGGDLPQQAEKAVQLAQDEFRSVATDGELDGRPPSVPAVVARRRYGDTKDLSFLLLHMLKALGVEARLVLVNIVFRQSIGALLPAPGLFNHLLVEYRAGSETRWVDATRRRAIGSIGLGLPLGGAESSLVRPPVGSTASAYELKESILIDTSGGWSWLAVVVTARGLQAEILRQELELEGLEAVAKKRLRDHAAHFPRVRRTGKPEYRDDRAANEFSISEVFEIRDFMKMEAQGKWFRLDLPNPFIADSLKAPDPGPRHSPYALPHPCHLTHVIELHSVALAPAVIQQRAVKTDFLEFTRVRKTLAGFWTMKLSLRTLADAVAADAVEEHRDALQDIRAQSTWSMLLPIGDARPHRRGDFGALPRVISPVAPTVPPPARAPSEETPETPPPITPPAPAPEMAPPSVATEMPPPRLKRRRKRHHRRNRAFKWKSRRAVLVACVLGLTLIVAAILMAKNADYWRVFRRRPPPPAADLKPSPDR